jgi:hypothetical protein
LLNFGVIRIRLRRDSSRERAWRGGGGGQGDSALIAGYARQILVLDDFSIEIFIW